VSELPRLLFCCFDVVPGPSAISRRLTEYIKGLSERFQVVVLSVKTPDHPHIERYCGARLLRVPVGAGDLASRSQTFDRAVRRQLESEEYGLVHFFDPFAGYALCERRGELGYRLIYDACTFPSVELPLENPSLEADRRFLARVRRQELYCLMNADGVVVGNPLTATWVTGLGVEREHVRVLRAPVDLEPFKPEVMGKPDATPMKVLHLGRITKGQGLETLLEALHLALQTIDVRLTVVGPKQPEALARLEAQVAALKLTGKVEFQEPVAHDDIFKVLATCDVGALTLDDVERNQTVGTPLARLGEYLAAGRPVIAADVASTRALLPAEVAVLYRPGDARSLADALVQLAADAPRRVKLGTVARASTSEWDGARVRLQLLKLYAEVTGALLEGARREAFADPFEPTQLGSAPTDPGEVTQLGARARGSEDSGVGTGKVKTDPAITARADSSTDAAALPERPPVMGVLLREDVQVTEPGAKPASEPTVVMGSLLREEREGPSTTAGVVAAMNEALPTPLPGVDALLPGPAASPAALEVHPPSPSVPTKPDAVEPTAPTGAPAPAVFVPPLSDTATAWRAKGADALHAPSDTDPGSRPARSETTPQPIRAYGAQPAAAGEAPGASHAPSPANAEPPSERLRSAVYSPDSPGASPPGTVETKAGQQRNALERPTHPTMPAATPPPPEAPPHASPPHASGARAAPDVRRDDAPSSASHTSPPSPPLPASVAVPPLRDISPAPALERSMRSDSGPRAAAATAESTVTQPSPQRTTASHAAQDSELDATADANVSARTREAPAGIPGPPFPPAAKAAAQPGPEVRLSAPVKPPLPAANPVGGQRDVASAPVPVQGPPGTSSSAAGQRLAPPSQPPALAPPDPSDSDIVEVGADEVLEVIDDAPEASPSDTAEEIMEADEAVQAVDTDPSPPPSALDPWLAQLVHGYCPPESQLFDRHTPPTTMPGRDT
jgi:glycosyltransferase involved in cell wall biosynthesis